MERWSGARGAATGTEALELEFLMQVPARLRLQPQPGRLALFPSYQWHGVEPFPGHGERMTVAFDVVPTGG